jgi:hypothetical protein
MTGLLRRSPIFGFGVLSALAGVLAGVPASASDTTAPLPQPQTTRDLVRMPAADLQALFSASPVGSVPNGYVPGRAIKNPGSRWTGANSRATRLVWQGKYFRNDGTMVNRFFGVGRAIPADVYEGESWLDGHPALIFDYSRSKLWPNVRDEVREVAPGLYLGIMYKDGAPKNPPMFFTLDARK